MSNLQGPKLEDLRKYIESELRLIGLLESELEAELELILSRLTKTSRLERLREPERVLPEETVNEADAILKRRKQREPLQYILGETEFFGLRFLVRANVLIPRSDTETLVEAAIEHLRHLGAGKKKLRLAEIGIGTGIISVSLLKRFEQLQAYACDISAEAVRLSLDNADLNAVAGRIVIEQADWQDWLARQDKDFDLLIANPPYIPVSEIKELAPELILWEPHQALFGGDADGLGFYRELAKFPSATKKKFGLVILEIGFGQRNAVEDIFCKCSWSLLACKKDLSGIDRAILLAAPDSPF